MKVREKKELHHKTTEELQKSIAEKHKELFDAKLEHTQGRLKNPRVLKALRVTIAQMLTVLREKDLSAGRQGWQEGGNK